MYEWNETVQKMIDWIEQNLNCKHPLQRLADYTGYSPYYCSVQFHSITGKTIRDYITSRRISKVALELRDTDKRILDIAYEYGFSSQEALTRCFVSYFNVTPNKYRKQPQPISLAYTKEVYKPSHYQNKNNNSVTPEYIEIFTQVIEQHKFIGIWDIDCANYGQFFNKYNCDEVCGTIESLSHLTLKNQLTHMAGWFFENGKKGYFYGIPISAKYKGVVPKKMQCRLIDKQEYLTFYHPSFSYLQNNIAIMSEVEKMAFSFNPRSLGYNWLTKSIYQKHHPELYGYGILRPIEKI